MTIRLFSLLVYFLMVLPIYEALLERDLEKDAELAAQEMNRVGDLPAKV